MASQQNELCDIVTVGSSQDRPDRRSVCVGGNVVIGTGPRSISGIRASSSLAPTARIDEESTTTREKSIWSAARSFASSTACSRPDARACCQSRSLRQQLTPEPHPISDGKSRQRMPFSSTNRMLVRAARSATGLRAGYLNGAALAQVACGSISAQSSSSMIELPLPLARLSRRPRSTEQDAEKANSPLASF